MMMITTSSSMRVKPLSSLLYLLKLVKPLGEKAKHTFPFLIVVCGGRFYLR